MMEHEILKENYKIALDKFVNERKVIVEQIRAIFEKFITDDTVKLICDDSHTYCVIPRPNSDFGHDFDIYYDKDWDGGARKVRLNVGTFGSFNYTETSKVAYYVVVGQLASNLEKIQAEFDKLDWKTFDELQHAKWSAHHKLEAFENEIRRAEEQKRKQEIESKLIPGAKIKTSVGYSHYSHDIYYEIDHVTPKRVYFKEIGIRSKDEVVNNFFKHYQPWTFV